MNFRQDINGLRAIAVLAVLFFHFDKEFLPGGFAGVDVFFVISGYLMSGIILTSLEKAKFSLWNFLKRRIERIVPPLAFLIIFLLCFGYFFMIPMDYRDLAQHGLNSLLFYSNHVFYTEIDYFDELVNLKWLLHSWSLSVEWQFYLLWPIIIFFLTRVLSPRFLKQSIFFLLIFLFIVNVFLSGKNPSLAYYLLPARAWEMLMGAVVFCYPIDWQQNSLLRRLSYIAGLIAILSSMFIVHSKLSWPSFYALLPTMGTGLILLSNMQAIALSNKFMQTLGKYSYSIYLWHWPVLVGFTYLKIDLPMLSRLIWYLLITSFLSFISFQFFERKMSSPKLRVTTGCAFLLSLAVLLSGGGAFRVPEELRLSADEYHKEYYGGSGSPTNTRLIHGLELKEKIDAYVVGDSFAHQYSRYIHQYGIENNNKYVGFYDHGCMIFKDYTRYINNLEDRSCSEGYRILSKAVALDDGAPMVIAYSWESYQSELGIKGGKPHELTLSQYLEVIEDQLLKFRRDFGNRKYYLVGVPQRSKTLSFNCLASPYLLGAGLLSKCESEIAYTRSKLNSFLEEFASGSVDFVFVDPNEFMCKNDKCRLFVNGKPLHSDLSHLSIFGAALVGEGLLKALRSAVR